MKILDYRSLSLFLAAAFLLLILDWTRLTAPFFSFTAVATLPIQMGAHALRGGLTDSLLVVAFWRSGEVRIRSLEERNAELTAAAERVGALERENLELRKQLGEVSVAQSRFSSALVVGAGTGLIIAKGSQDSIRVGQSVTYLNNLVGRVIKVTPQVSFVELPTGGGSKIPCRIRQAHCLAVGQFNSSIFFDRVAQNEEVLEGDVVLTSGEDGVFAPGLVIGKVVSKNSKDTDLFVRGEVRPLIDYGRLTTVFLPIN